jgi:hypothetical protein
MSKKVPSYNNKSHKKGNQFKKQPKLTNYIYQKDIDNAKPIVHSDRSEYLLSLVGEKCRGFGLRHWKKLYKFMSKEKFEESFICQIKISFYKFKLIRALDPENSNDIIWIFKHLLTLEGQKFYKDCYEQCLDIDATRARHTLMQLGRNYEHLVRVLDYMDKCDEGLMIPYGAFPLIYYEKSKMDLAFREVTPIDEKEKEDTIRRYLFKLDLKELFIPPADILYKIGNNFYNDRGEIKKDYERASKYDSGFKYQAFMAQPLQPREVWLPSKKIKHNNLFWMIICRQFLKRDPTYPVPDPDVLWNRLKDMGHFMRFDISGFGFQYIRKYLEILVRVIEEMYPCSLLTIMSDEAVDIFNDVRVEMPDGSVVRPPRGIGLGYYEDLKTICMIAILDKYQPYSVYGDQGLIPTMTGWDALTDLISSGFIFDSDDKVWASSTADTSAWSVKWAGIRMSPQNYKIYKDLSSKILNLFFVREHWERKNGLYSFYKEYPEFYKRNNKKFIKLYQLYFGDELYPNDTSTSFNDVGINANTKHTVGYKKDYRLSNYKVPYSDQLFELPYSTPFLTRKKNVWPIKVAKDFSKKRLAIYKNSPFIDSSVYYYVNPRLEYNSVFRPSEKLLPEWAEYLYIAMHGASTGSFTYNLTSSKMKGGIMDMSLSKDPLRAVASGGYKILDMHHRRPLACLEWQSTVDALSTVTKRHIDYIQRADLPVSIYWQEDPFYFNTPLYMDGKKRKRLEKEVPSNNQGDDENNSEVAQFRNKLIKCLGTGKIDNPKSLIHVEELDNNSHENEYIFDDDDIIPQEFNVNDYDFEESNNNYDSEEEW